ncbi:hypothetical protein [Prevotella falsenii]|nr:hypothetical protein [Prevotella falsenii]
MYVCPKIEIISVNLEYLMVEASGDHSHIGQGGTVGDAKQWEFTEENEE